MTLPCHFNFSVSARWASELKHLRLTLRRTGNFDVLKSPVPHPDAVLCHLPPLEAGAAAHAPGWGGDWPGLGLSPSLRSDSADLLGFGKQEGARGGWG